MLLLNCLFLMALRAAPIECPLDKSVKPVDCTVLRYDSSGFGSMENMTSTPACILLSDKPIDSFNTILKTQRSLKSNILAQNPNPFSIDFTCEAGVDARKCRQAQAGFVSAGIRIAQIIAFPQTVKVKATFKSFCNGNLEGCALADTLGQASPAAYFSARPESEKGSWYFYPVLYPRFPNSSQQQALVKQVIHDIELVYNDYDILAEFNADFNFWFANESSAAITPDQTDFEFVYVFSRTYPSHRVSHEFTHGLGFDTAWSQWGSLFPSAATEKSYLAPLPFISGQTVSTASVPNWQPLTIFDRFTQDASSTPIIDRAKEIFSYSIHPFQFNTRRKPRL
jgi:hypothetical protein